MGVDALALISDLLACGFSKPGSVLVKMAPDWELPPNARNPTQIGPGKSSSIRNTRNGSRQSSPNGLGWVAPTRNTSCHRDRAEEAKSTNCVDYHLQGMSARRCSVPVQILAFSSASAMKLGRFG